ncbi:MAG: sulfotransferase family protein [Anaerolineales bacterium]|jgi:hypothetical protein
MAHKYRNRLAAAIRYLISGRYPPGERARNPDFDIPPISEKEIAEAKTFFSMEKFFIFGHARSGTTLLTRLIRLHYKVHCNYQGHFFTRPPLLQSLVSDEKIQSWLTRRSNRWNRGKNPSPVILRAAVDFILEREAKSLGKSIVGDKSPNSLLNGKAVRLLNNIYPDARLIYIVRDGRDAVVSHRFQSFIDATQHLSEHDWKIRETFINDPESFINGKNSIFTEKGLRRSAQGWDLNVRETVEIGKALFNDRFYSLKYEHLVENPLEELPLLWNFLNAGEPQTDIQELIANEMQSNPDADWQNQKAGEIASALQKGKRGNWEQYFNNNDRRIFEEIAGNTLKNWGYI